MKAQMYVLEEECCICNEAITNPICHDCLNKEVMTWVKTRNPELVKYVEGIKDIFKGLYASSTTCILCGNVLNVCAHCFVKEVYDSLARVNTEAAEAFKKAFNYELMPP